MFTRCIKSAAFIRYSNVLELFLGIMAMQNPELFQVMGEDLCPFKAVYTNLNVKVNDFMPPNDLKAAEISLTELLKDKYLFINDLDDENTQLVKVKYYSILKKFWQAAQPNINENKKLYEKWQQEVEINSKPSIIRLLETITSEELSLRHKLMLEKAQQIHIIPSIYVYPQVGYNLIGEQLFLLIGIPKDGLINNELNKHTLARAFHALSEVKRLEILQLINNNLGIQGVDIAKEVQLTPATVNHHISTLVQAGLVSREREGRSTNYALEKSRLGVLIRFINSLK